MHHLFLTESEKENSQEIDFKEISKILLLPEALTSIYTILPSENEVGLFFQNFRLNLSQVNCLR